MKTKMSDEKKQEMFNKFADRVMDAVKWSLSDEGKLEYVSIPKAKDEHKPVGLIEAAVMVRLNRLEEDMFKISRQELSVAMMSHMLVIIAEKLGIDFKELVQLGKDRMFREALRMAIDSAIPKGPNGEKPE